jgi:hypothetical protein
LEDFNNSISKNIYIPQKYCIRFFIFLPKNFHLFWKKKWGRKKKFIENFNISENNNAISGELAQVP